MSRKLDLKVGDSVLVKIEEMSNASRVLKMTLENQNEWLFDGIVTAIGRKYVTVKFGWREDKFSIEDDYRQKYTCGGADYKLYKDRQEVLDEKESEVIYKELRGVFSSFRNNNTFSLDQLKRIKGIVNEIE